MRRAMREGQGRVYRGATRERVGKGCATRIRRGRNARARARAFFLFGHQPSRSIHPAGRAERREVKELVMERASFALGRVHPAGRAERRVCARSVEDPGDCSEPTRRDALRART